MDGGRRPRLEICPNGSKPSPSARNATGRRRPDGRRPDLAMTTPDDPAFDAYKTLQVDSEADPEVIQAAYRRLAQKWHPDVAQRPGGGGPDGRDQPGLGDPERPGPPGGVRPGAGADGRGRGRVNHAGARMPSATPRGRRPSRRHQPRRARPPARPPAGSCRAPRRRARAPRAARPARPSRSRATGRAAARRSGSGRTTRRRCGRTTRRAAPDRRPATHRAASSTSAATAAGRSARSPGTNLEFLEWLDRMPIGRPYRDEIDVILRQAGRRRSRQPEATDRRGLFRRR